MRTSRSRPQRRKLVWAQTDTNFTPIAAAGFQTVDLLDAFRLAGGETVGATVMRTHLRLIVAPTTAPTTSTRAIISMLVRDRGAAPPPTGFNASTNPYADWMIADSRSLCAGAQGAAPVVATALAAQTWDYDVRSKRKVEELQETLWLIITPDAVTAFNCRVWARVLLALP